MGFCNSYVEINLDKKFNYFGIRFLPGMFPLLFNIDASELSNHYECLHAVQPHLHHVIQQSRDKYKSIKELCSEFNLYFINRINQVDSFFDNRFFHALGIILCFS